MSLSLVLITFFISMVKASMKPHTHKFMKREFLSIVSLSLFNWIAIYVNYTFTVIQLVGGGGGLVVVAFVVA